MLAENWSPQGWSLVDLDPICTAQLLKLCKALRVQLCGHRQWNRVYTRMLMGLPAMQDRSMQ